MAANKQAQSTSTDRLTTACGRNSRSRDRTDLRSQTTLPKQTQQRVPDTRKGTHPIVDSKGGAIAELMLEVAQFFFRKRAVGQKAGLITSWGGGTFGFLRSLALLGPLTVPQVAQMRPTSRQRMQRLADELAAEGLVEFVDNPKHRRSKLVQLAPKGDTRYRELNVRFLAVASTLGVNLSEGDVRRTRKIVRRLSDEVKRRSQRPS